eukprot:3765707-Prymnesium_polylepis.1
MPTQLGDLLPDLPANEVVVRGVFPAPDALFDEAVGKLADLQLADLQLGSDQNAPSVATSFSSLRQLSFGFTPGLLAGLDDTRWGGADVLDVVGGQQALEDELLAQHVDDSKLVDRVFDSDLLDQALMANELVDWEQFGFKPDAAIGAVLSIAVSFTSTVQSFTRLGDGLPGWRGGVDLLEPLHALEELHAGGDDELD